MATIHIAPAVADHPALRQINAEFTCGASQHAGFRLAAIAIGQPLAGMITNLHAVNRKLRHQVRVDFFNNFPLQSAAANVRLVRCHNQQKTGGF